MSLDTSALLELLVNLATLIATVYGMYQIVDASKDKRGDFIRYSFERFRCPEVQAARQIVHLTDAPKPITIKVRGAAHGQKLALTRAVIPVAIKTDPIQRTPTQLAVIDALVTLLEAADEFQGLIDLGQCERPDLYAFEGCFRALTADPTVVPLLHSFIDGESMCSERAHRYIDATNSAAAANAASARGRKVAMVGNTKEE